MAYTSRHKTLSDAIEWLHRIVSELVELLAAPGENTSLQVQAQCKLDELKKIQDDLNTDKDPNASQQREQPSSSQATDVVTNAVVEGESQRGEVASGDKGPTGVKLSVLSDSDHDLQAGEHFISNDDLDKDDEGVGIVDELRPNEDVDHAVMSKGGNVSYSMNVQSSEGVEVDFENLRGISYKNTSKRFERTQGEFSGQIRSWDWDEQNHLVLIKRMDGVQYFKPRFQTLSSLPGHDLHRIAQLNLNTPTENGLICHLKKVLENESRAMKWEQFTPAVGRRVRTRNKFSAIPLRQFDLDNMAGIKFWYLDGRTGEAIITKQKVSEVTVKVLDPMWLVNFKLSDLKKLRRLPMYYNAEDRELVMPFIRVVQFCVKNKVGVGSDYSKV
ncbi:hypothetical protein Hanom_Chr05g00397141 [Helianthus anomalus]